MISDDDIKALQDRIEKHIDVGNTSQVVLFQDILAESNLPTKLSKICKLSLSIFESNVRTGDNTILEQNSRLISHLNHCIAFFQILCSDIQSDPTKLQLFLASEQFQYTYKLVPKSYFFDLSEKIKKIINSIKSDPNQNSQLANYNGIDFPEKIKELRILKTKVDFLQKPDEIKAAFDEMCSLFELSTLILDLSTQKSINDDKILFQKKISDLTAENERIRAQNSKSTIDEYEAKIFDMKNQISSQELKIRELKNENLDLQNKVSNFEKKNNEQIKYIKDLEGEIDNKENSLTKLQAKFSVLQKQSEILKNQMSNFDDTKVEKLENDLQAANNQLIAKEKSLSSYRERIQDLQNNLAEKEQNEENIEIFKQKISDQEDLLNQANILINNKENQIINLKQEFLTAKMEFDKYMQEQQQKEAEMISLQSEISKLKEIQTEADDLRDSLREKSLTIDQMSEELRNLPERQKLLEKIEQFQEEIAKLTATIDLYKKKQVENDSIAENLKNLKFENQNLRTKLAQNEENLVAIKSKIETSHKDIENQKKFYEEKIIKLKTKNKEDLQGKNNLINSLKLMAKSLETDKKKLSVQINELKNSLSESQNKVDSEEYNKIQAENSRLKQQNQDISKDKENISKKYQEIQEKLKDYDLMMTKITQMEQNQKETKGFMTKMSHKINEQENQIKRLTKKISSQNTSLQEKDDLIQQLKTDNENLTLQAESFRASQQESVLLEEISKTASQAEKLREKNLALQSSNEEKKKKMKVFRNHISYLSEQNEKLSAENKELKSIIDSPKRNQTKSSFLINSYATSEDSSVSSVFENRKSILLENYMAKSQPSDKLSKANKLSEKFDKELSEIYQ